MADLVEDNLALVRWQMGRMNMPSTLMLDYDDIYQEGVLGLMEAARGFNPDRGFTFATYAQQIIRGRILDASRRVHGRPGSGRHTGMAAIVSMDKLQPRADENELTLADTLPGPEDTEAQALNRVEAQQTMGDLLLPYRDWQRLYLRAQGLTYREISARVGVTEAAIGQTLERIRRQVEFQCDRVS